MWMGSGSSRSSMHLRCQETGCAQRDLAHVQDTDLSLGIAMTDAVE